MDFDLASELSNGRMTDAQLAGRGDSGRFLSGDPVWKREFLARGPTNQSPDARLRRLVYGGYPAQNHSVLGLLENKDKFGLPLEYPTALKNADQDYFRKALLTKLFSVTANWCKKISDLVVLLHRTYRVGPEARANVLDLMECLSVWGLYRSPLPDVLTYPICVLDESVVVQLRGRSLNDVSMDITSARSYILTKYEAESVEELYDFFCIKHLLLKIIDSSGDPVFADFWQRIGEVAPMSDDQKLEKGFDLISSCERILHGMTGHFTIGQLTYENVKWDKFSALTYQACVEIAGKNEDLLEGLIHEAGEYLEGSGKNTPDHDLDQARLAMMIGAGVLTLLSLGVGAAAFGFLGASAAAATATGTTLSTIAFSGAISATADAAALSLDYWANKQEDKLLAPAKLAELIGEDYKVLDETASAEQKLAYQLAFMLVTWGAVRGVSKILSRRAAKAMRAREQAPPKPPGHEPAPPPTKGKGKGKGEAKAKGTAPTPRPPKNPAGNSRARRQAGRKRRSDFYRQQKAESAALEASEAAKKAKTRGLPTQPPRPQKPLDRFNNPQDSVAKQVRSEILSDVPEDVRKEIDNGDIQFLAVSQRQVVQVRPKAVTAAEKAARKAERESAVNVHLNQQGHFATDEAGGKVADWAHAWSFRFFNNRGAEVVVDGVVQQVGAEQVVAAGRVFNQKFHNAIEGYLEKMAANSSQKIEAEVVFYGPGGLLKADYFQMRIWINNKKVVTMFGDVWDETYFNTFAAYNRLSASARKAWGLPEVDLMSLY